MKLKLIKSLAGPDGNFNAGDEIEREDKVAVELIQAGAAIPVKNLEIEKAIAPPVETGKSAPPPVLETKKIPEATKSRSGKRRGK